ncbi:GTPase [Streptomyces globosus]|uniref:GTPase n=1 Tax=Streptomyces globosus TaxID=68209 RepID=UPI00364570C8
MSAAHAAREPHDWASRAETAVREVTGPAGAAALAGSWAAIALRPVPTVVLYGPQNAGKTSLLRRLLAEDGTTVPGWAAVSARKETFAADAVESGGLRYVDTPGLMSGDPLHTERAETALAEADALLLVLNRRGLAADRPHLLAVATGSHFHADRPRPFPAGALLPVVTMADRWGADPGTEEFDELVRETRSALHAQLAPHTGERSTPAAHVVVADPYQMAAGVPAGELRPEHYPLGDAWDGIAALRSALHALAGRTAELRAHTRTRFWTRHAAAALDAGRAELAEAEAALAGACRQRDRALLHEARLDAACAAASARLRALLREELARLVDAAPPAEGDEALRRRAENRLATTTGAWRAAAAEEVRRLAFAARAETAAAAAAPGNEAFAAYVDEVVELLRSDAAEAPEPTVPQVAPAGAVWLGLGPLALAARHETRRRLREHHAEHPEETRRALADFTAGEARDGDTPAPGQAAPPPADTAPDPGAWHTETGPAADDGGAADQPDASASDATAPDASASGASAPDASVSDASDAYGPAGYSADAYGFPGAPAAAGTGGGAPAGHAAEAMVGLVEEALVFAAWYHLERRTRKQAADTAREAARRAARRRAAIDDLTERIAAGREEDWLRLVAATRTAIRAGIPADALMEPLRAERDRLRRAVGTLDRVLGELPL